MQIGKGCIQIVDGDGHMVDVVRQHAPSLPVEDCLSRNRLWTRSHLFDEIDVEAELCADRETILVPEVPAHCPGEFPSDREAEADTLPVVIKSQPLEWPRNAARSNGKGVVVLQLTVNASGGVDGVELLRADDTGWGIPETAIEAASGYRFKPGTKNGVAITTYSFVTWRYDFTGE